MSDWREDAAVVAAHIALDDSIGDGIGVDGGLLVAYRDAVAAAVLNETNCENMNPPLTCASESIDAELTCPRCRLLADLTSSEAHEDR